jgi:predicted O-methyltransferase YrrM
MNYNFNTIWNSCLKFNIEQKPEEFKLFLDHLSNTKKRKYALEIGSNFGGTSVALCHLYEKVIAIDIKHHENFDTIKEKYPNFNYIIGDSTSNDTVEAIKNLGVEFDLIFIDGDHSYNGVKNDYDKFKQFLADDGYLAFHDVVESDVTKEYDIFVYKFWDEIIESYNEYYTFFATEKDDKYSKDNEFHKLLQNTHYSLWGGIGLIKNHKVSIFSHNFLQNNWVHVLQSQLQKLSDSGLYKRSDKIFYNVITESYDDFNLFNKMVKTHDIDKKFNICWYEKNEDEFLTLIKLQNYSYLNPCGSTLYFHTKGTSRPYDSNIESWRECLEYFCIENWGIPFKDLKNKNCDLSGALYVEYFKFLEYEFKNYFSGNFWWANNSYINTLPNLSKLKIETNNNRSIQERWIGMSPHTWKSYYNENVSSWYEHYFDPKKYKFN